MAVSKKTQNATHTEQPTPNRFKILNNQNIEVTAQIGYSELCDLPNSTMDFVSEVVTLNLSQTAKEGLAAMLRAIKTFFPDETEREILCEGMKL